MDGPEFDSSSASTGPSHRRKLIKKPPSHHYARSSSGFDAGAGYDAVSLGSKRSSQSLRRAPSAPPARSNPATASGYPHTNTFRSNPSPNLAPGDFTSPNSYAPVSHRQTYNRLSDSHLRPLSKTPAAAAAAPDDLIGAPFDGAAILNRIESTKVPTPQGPGHRHHHPSPQLQTGFNSHHATPVLRNSASFAAMDQGLSEKGLGPRAPTDVSMTSTKRYSDDGQVKPAVLRKKSGFSGFMNSLVGSPKKPVISAPENPVHVTHVGYDSTTGQFTVSSPPTPRRRISRRLPSSPSINPSRRDCPKNGSD